MRTIKLIYLVFLLIGCNKRNVPFQNASIPEEIDEILDIRVYDDGRLFINGQSSNYSALYSLMQSFNITKNTLVRFLFVEGEQSDLVIETTRQIQLHGTFRIHKISMNIAEFHSYIDENVHIDILGSGRLLIDGYELFIEDLIIAMGSEKVSKPKKVIITLVGGYQESTLHRTLQIIDSLGYKTIEYTDMTIWDR